MSNSTLPISVFIITFNEEKRIRAALEAVLDLSNDIVIVDSGSTDATLEIARELDVKYIINAPFPGYGEQKRFAEGQCQNDWVLNIDADEVVSLELKQSIRQVFASGKPSYDGYCVAQTDIPAYSKEVPLFSYHRWPIRLYRKSQGTFNTSKVHDVVDMLPGSRIAKLHGILLHYSLLNYHQQIEKLNRYSSMQANDFMAKNRTISMLRAIFQFPLSFLKAYIFRRYVFQGLTGFFISINYAHYRTMRLAKIFEMKRRKSAGSDKDK